MLCEWVSKNVGNFVHDNAGWIMMIWAMLMIWGEMSLLSALRDRDDARKGLFPSASGVRSVAAEKSPGRPGAFGSAS